MTHHRYLIIVLTFPLALSGCSLPKTHKHNQESKYFSLSSPLTQLSTDGEELIRTGNPPANLSDAEFINMATAHDPGLRAMFVDYELHVQRGTPYVAILVCEKKNGNTYAVQEDYSCTSKLDKQLWKDAPNSPCLFSAAIATVCPISKK